MPCAKPVAISIYTCCFHRQSRSSLWRDKYGENFKPFSSSSALSRLNERPEIENATQGQDVAPNPAQEERGETGAMSRRLADMMDENIEQGGRGAEKIVEDSGFSIELKRRLEAKILDSKFKSENSAAFAQLDMPSSAGRGTKTVAIAQSWAGTERIEDAALRMLTDAYKPLRGSGPPKIPVPRGMPVNVDTRMNKAIQRSQGQRLANARDRTSVYSLSQDPTLNPKEKEQMRSQFKERFIGGARPMPASVQGLAALADQRIEDAIARGQFKNIARGKGKNIERDYTASSPFLDTTEYFMNKIIQKQEIVPPWIEKQQELVKATAVFRSRLRADWKRHAARMIASKGGSLDAQIRRAEAYAAAEASNTPRIANVEALSEIEKGGQISQISVTETPIPSNTMHDSKITVSKDLASKSPTSEPDPSTSIEPDPSTSISSSTETPPSPTSPQRPSLTSTGAPARPFPLASLSPFRDPAWESLELPYHTLAVKSLNSLTRSYNLQAPDLAKKPYFSLLRELRACFADIAPQLPHEIRERATARKVVGVEVVGHRPGGVLEKFAGERAKVFDSVKPHYGFRQFWRDLWGREG